MKSYFARLVARAAPTAPTPAQSAEPDDPFEEGALGAVASPLPPSPPVRTAAIEPTPVTARSVQAKLIQPPVAENSPPALPPSPKREHSSSPPAPTASPAITEEAPFLSIPSQVQPYREPTAATPIPVIGVLTETWSAAAPAKQTPARASTPDEPVGRALRQADRFMERFIRREIDPEPEAQDGQPAPPAWELPHAKPQLDLRAPANPEHHEPGPSAPSLVIGRLVVEVVNSSAPSLAVPEPARVIVGQRNGPGFRGVPSTSRFGLGQI